MVYTVSTITTIYQYKTNLTSNKGPHKYNAAEYGQLRTENDCYTQHELVQ